MNRENALQIYERMYLIRQTEEMIANRYSEGHMRCPMHLSIGQEAVAAAAGLATTAKDLAVSTHRCHAHYLGKGGSLKAMLAELHGKATGCSRGKGGSMHLIDESVGFMGATAIVANSIPIGVGLALAMQIKREPAVAITFLGDGSIEEGTFYESANFAVVRKLPVLFLCENNLYSVYSPLSVRQPAGRQIRHLAAAIGLRSQTCDGNNVLSCFDEIQAARARIMDGDGPQFIEFATYRWREHCGPQYDNTIGYRSEEEFKFWRARDPVRNFRIELDRQFEISESAIEAIESRINAQVADAFAFAQTSPFPKASTGIDGLFAETGFAARGFTEGRP